MRQRIIGESLLEILIFLFERVKSIAATSGTDSLTQGGRGEKGKAHLERRYNEENEEIH